MKIRNKIKRDKAIFILIILVTLTVYIAFFLNQGWVDYLYHVVLGLIYSFGMNKIDDKYDKYEDAVLYYNDYDIEGEYIVPYTDEIRFPDGSYFAFDDKRTVSEKYVENFEGKDLYLFEKGELLIKGEVLGYEEGEGITFEVVEDYGGYLE
jgi:hypothetical protein